MDSNTLELTLIIDLSISAQTRWTRCLSQALTDNDNLWGIHSVLNVHFCPIYFFKSGILSAFCNIAVRMSSRSDSLPFVVSLSAEEERRVRANDREYNEKFQYAVRVNLSHCRTHLSQNPNPSTCFLSPE